MTVGQVWEQIKNAASFAIKPVEERGEAAETPTEGQEAAADAVAASTNVDTGLTVFEAVSDETGETVAVGKMARARRQRAPLLRLIMSAFRP